MSCKVLLFNILLLFEVICIIPLHGQSADEYDQLDRSLLAGSIPSNVRVSGYVLSGGPCGGYSNYSPAHACVRTKTITQSYTVTRYKVVSYSSCHTRWFRRRCTTRYRTGTYYQRLYRAVTTTEHYCHPSWIRVGSYCFVPECGGCVLSTVSNQPACLHMNRSNKPYCCSGFLVEYKFGEYRCVKGIC